MGGYGSGPRLVKVRGLVSDCLTLDVRKIAKYYKNFKNLADGQSTAEGTLTWVNSYTGKEIGEIAHQLKRTGEAVVMSLRYSVTRTGEDRSTPFTYDIRLERRRVFGRAYRFLFRCPACDRWAVKLYCRVVKGADCFACRLCNGLTYYSTRHNRKRTLEWARKYTAKLDKKWGGESVKGGGMCR